MAEKSKPVKKQSPKVDKFGKPIIYETVISHKTGKPIVDPKTGKPAKFPVDVD